MMDTELDKAQRVIRDLEASCANLTAEIAHLEHKLTSAERDRAEMAERYDVAVMTIRAQAAWIVESQKP